MIPVGNAAVPKPRPAVPEPEPAPEPKKPKAPINRSIKPAGGGGLDDLFGAPMEGRVRMGRSKKKTVADDNKKKE